jgi:hypothetical protein
MLGTPAPVHVTAKDTTVSEQIKADTLLSVFCGGNVGEMAKICPDGIPWEQLQRIADYVNQKAEQQSQEIARLRGERIIDKGQLEARDASIQHHHDEMCRERNAKQAAEQSQRVTAEREKYRRLLERALPCFYGYPSADVEREIKSALSGEDVGKREAH